MMRVPGSAIWVSTGAVASVGIGVGLRSAPTSIPTFAVAALAVLLAATMSWLAGGARCYRLGVTPTALRLGVAGVLAHTMWMVGFRFTTDPVWWVAGMGVLSALEFGAATAATHIRAHQARLGPKPVDMSGDKPTRLAKAALALAKLDYLRPLSWSPMVDPRDPETSIGLKYQLQLPPDRDPPGPGAAARLANAFSEVMQRQLDTSWVQLRAEAAAGVLVATVMVRNAVANVILYQDALSWTSITEPAELAFRQEGTPLLVNLAQNVEVIGRIGSGKSVMLHIMLAHLTRCRDAVVWVCGAEKVYDLVAGWVDPYEDTDYPLPIDWIANGQRHVVDMLVAAMTVIRWRQRQPMSARTGWPHIVIILDEASFALRNRKVVGIYQSQEMTASQLAGMISQAGRSAKVWLVRATQRSTQDHGGMEGGDIKANTCCTFAFASGDWAEIGRLIGGKEGYSLEMPWEPGQCWVRDGRIPELVKGLYIQDVDPDAPVLHDGATVADVAWSRREFLRPLDAGSAAAAGPVYTQRQTRMTPVMRRYLNGNPTEGIEDDAPAEDPRDAGYRETMAKLRVLEGGKSDDLGSAAVTLSRQRPRSARIVDIIAEHGPVTRAEIVALLVASGDTEAGDQTVTNALTDAVREGKVTRPERGLYVPPGWSPQANTEGREG